MTKKPNDARVSRELKCWSCKAVFTLSEHGNCDGCCWKCGVEIDLHEMDIQPADQYPQGTRERFQKWVLSIEHPVKGWLDGHWLRRGDDREGYADEYVQGLWVAFKAFGAQPADQQGEPVAWLNEATGHVTTSSVVVMDWDDEKEPVQSLYRHAQPATVKVVLRAEARECRECNHVGINDESPESACHSCDWSGGHQAEDKCPGCGDENCMAAACPKCGGRYVLIAEAKLNGASKVVLPERLDLPHRDEFESADQHAAAVGETKTWNACLDEVAKLNTPQ